MGWFRKRSGHKTEPPQPREVRGFKAVHFNAEAMPRNPTRARIEQLANSDDELALREAIAELGDLRAGAPMWLAFPPITSAKVATLSLLMFDAQPDVGLIPGMNVANVASLALWQLLLSGAKPDQLATLERIASPEASHANYDAAYGILSALMTSSLGRDLKAGEMENVRHLIGTHLGLSPEQLLHAHTAPERAEAGMSSATGVCKAFHGGRCAVDGVDTGPCDWNPSNWRTCNVVIENMKYGGW